jgi:CopG family nickel-responsive transcriptional regulator
MTKIVRASITFPPELLKDFDDAVSKMGYANRSKAVQDAVRMFVSEKKMLQKESGVQTGVLMMLYDHEIKGLENTLTDVQHEYAEVICSTMHVHINERECIEVIAVKGDSGEIRKLSDELTAKKGMKILRTVVVPI